MELCSLISIFHASWSNAFGNENGGTNITWSAFGSEVSYQILRKKEFGNYEPISLMDFSKGAVRALNVYPFVDSKANFTLLDGTKYTMEKSASLKVWIEGGYIDNERINPAGNINGQQKIYVDLCSSKDFNSNPNIIFDYDVVMYGSWDANNDIDPNNQPTNESLSAIKKYIDEGYGFLAGHDTIRPGTVLSRIAKDSFGIYVNGTVDHANSGVTDIAVIQKKGILTHFPHDLGEIGTKIIISPTHAQLQYAANDLWMTLEYPEKITQDFRNQMYLTSKGNAAMIQTGHSGANSREAEQKIIANTIFALKQRQNQTNIIDNTAWNYNPPSKPNPRVLAINKNSMTIEVNSQSGETKYFYKIVEQKSNDFIESDVPITATAPIEKYCYSLNGLPNSTQVSSIAEPICINTNGTNEFTFTVEHRNYGYLHIWGVDKIGNIGEFSSIFIGESLKFSQKSARMMKTCMGLFFQVLFFTLS